MPMPSLYLRLLGPPEVKAGVTDFSFALERRYQLLAYLAHAGEWVSRDKLAYLFWPDHSDEAARSNVRKALFKARKLSWLEGLEQTASSLRWEVDTDVKNFQSALIEEKFEVALELYRGPFLQGMELKAEAEFATWLELERQRLHGLSRTAVFSHADTLAKQDKVDKAVKALQRFLAHDALDEEAVQKLLILLSDWGEGEAGIKIYREFAARLERELGLEPSSETHHLFERLEGPRLQATSNVTVSPSFIGRTLELQELYDLLAQPDCRLLTVLGPGGVGKTRVALQLSKNLTKVFEDGVHVILLEALTAPEFIVSKIIESLGLTLQGVKEPLEYLKTHLAEKRLLLILDNFEHLINGAALLSELLTACPQLKLLVTSRERLKLAEEWLLPLEGLSYPKDADVTLEEALTYDAVQLFSSRAKRLQPHFTLTQADVPQLIDICHLVDGFPLGLELAASWVRYLSLAEIVKEIQSNTDFLHSQSRDVPARQQSIRATFEHSWNLLTAKEQEVLRQLSIFVGSFTRDAAEFVTSTPLSLLTGLVDKSLLRISPLKRYSQHPLLYEFTREKLTKVPHEQARIQQKHEDYFFRLLEDQFKDFKGERQKQALDIVQEERENILLAWHHALAKKHLVQVQRVAMPLAYHYLIRGPWQEGLNIFTAAQTTLKNVDTSAQSQAAEGEVLSAQAMLYCCLGKFAEAISSAEQGLAVLRLAGKEKRTLFCQNILGIVYYDTGDYARAEQHFKQALVLAKRVEDKARISAVLGNLAIVEVEIGYYQHAEKRYRELIELHRRDKNHDNLAAVLSDLGDVLRITNRLDEAVKVLEEGLKLAEELGAGYVIPTLLLSLGRTHLKRGAYESADAVFSRAYTESQTLGALRLQAESLYELGRLVLRSSALKNGVIKDSVVEKARDNFLQALHISLDIKTTPNLLSILTCFAELKAQQGQPLLAVKWLRLVLEHPTTRQADKDTARLLLGGLNKQLSPEDANRPLEHAKSLRLEAIIQDLLSEFSIRKDS